MSTDGNVLLATLTALASPQRLRIVAALAGGRRYVSELAREIGMSRPLLHMHLQRLEAAGVVSSKLELGGDGKAVKYFDVVPFAIELTPNGIAEAARTLVETPTPGQAEGTTL